MWVGIAVAVVLVVAGGWYLLSAGDKTVPDVVGMQAGDAVRELQNAGFVLGTSTADHRDRCAKRRGDRTDTEGRSQGQAGLRGVDRGLGEGRDGGSPRRRGAKKPLQPPTPLPRPVWFRWCTGTTTPTSPPGWSSRRYLALAMKSQPGASVAIGVSLGATPSNPKVPNVVGKTRADATASLENAGFKSQVYESYSPTATAGVVFTQFPAANTKALAGSTVAIGVSKGKAPTAPTPQANVKVPNVVGKTEAQANTALKNAGLGVASYTVFSDTVAKGSVVGQLPAAGASVAKDTVVGIAVSGGKAPQELTVPNLLGKTADEAYSALKSAGLVPVSVPDPESTEPDGTVVDQLPAAGSMVPPNSRVVLVIAGGAIPTPY